MKKKTSGWALIIAPLAAVLGYLLTNDYLIAGATLVLGALVINVYGVKSLNKVNKQLEHIAIAHQVIHSLTIDLSVKRSIQDAISGLREQLPNRYGELLDSGEGDYRVALGALARELDVAQFHVFCKTIELYEQQGGNPQSMNYLVLANIDNLKIKTDRLVKSRRTKVREISLMWGLTLLIVIYMRLGLAEFYLGVLENSLFRYSIGATLVFAIIALGALFSTYRNINLERGEFR